LLLQYLHRAWRRFRQNKGATGIDGITLDAYPKWVQAHWQNVKRGLERGY
jgi:RNA-directed DNA polymerase